MRYGTRVVQMLGPLTHAPLPFMSHVLVRQLLIVIRNSSKVSDCVLKAHDLCAQKRILLTKGGFFISCTRNLSQNGSRCGCAGQTTWSSKIPIFFSSEKFLPAHQIQTAFAHNAVAFIPIITIRGVRVCYRGLNIPGWRKSFCVGRKCCIKCLYCAPGLVIKGLGEEYMLISLNDPSDFLSDFLNSSS